MAVSPNDEESGGRSVKLHFSDTRLGALWIILSEGMGMLWGIIMTVPNMILARRSGREELDDGEERPSFQERMAARFGAVLFFLRWLVLGNEDEERSRLSRLLRIALGVGSIIIVVFFLIAGVMFAKQMLHKEAKLEERPPVTGQFDDNGPSAPLAAGDQPASGDLVPGGEKSGASQSAGGEDKGREKPKEVAASTEKKSVRERYGTKNVQEANQSETMDISLVQQQPNPEQESWDPVRLVIVDGLRVGSGSQKEQRLYGSLVNKSSRVLFGVVMAVHFKDSAGKDLAVKRINPLVISGGILGDRVIPLKSRQIRRFSVPLGHAPPGWSGDVTGDVVSVELKE